MYRESLFEIPSENGSVRHGLFNAYPPSVPSSTTDFPVPNHVPQPGALPRLPQIVPVMRMPEPEPYGPSRTMQFALTQYHGGLSSPALLRPEPVPLVRPGRSISDDPVSANETVSTPGFPRLDTSTLHGLVLLQHRPLRQLPRLPPPREEELAMNGLSALVQRRRGNGVLGRSEQLRH